MELFFFLMVVGGAAMLGYAVYGYKKSYIRPEWYLEKEYRKESTVSFWVTLLMYVFFGMALAILGLICLIKNLR